MAARRAGASPAGSRKSFPVVQPVESPPSLGLECGGFSKPKLLGPSLAKSFRTSARPPATPAQILAVEAADRMGDIKDIHRAYVCIEQCIRPISLREHDGFSASPAELGALLAAVNAEFGRLLEATDNASDALRKSLGKAARKAFKAELQAK